MSNSRVKLVGSVAFLEGSSSAVFFSKSDRSQGSYNSDAKGTVAPIKKLQNELNIAYWGEDNRFPQNVEAQMAYCNVGKSGLGWKARALYGNGIIPGKITGIDPKTQEEIFVPLDRKQYKEVYAFIERRSFYRFMLEYLQDWTWFSNCFPEMILDHSCEKITDLVHQESCDCRFQQFNDNGKIEYVFISKLWGAAKDQWAKFDPAKKMKGLLENPITFSAEDNEYVKKVPCIDMYNALQDLLNIAEKLKEKATGTLKSAILPVNYPSINKTYYQVAEWDGARLSGWVEIACKIPSLLKTLYNKAFSIKYHIEIPESYFEKKYTYEVWETKTEEEKKVAKILLLEEMDEFLSGNENAYNSFLSFFDIDNVNKAEYGRVKITPIEDKTKIDKELISASAADIQILIAMNVHPTLFGAGTIGTGQQRSGGSDIREAFLVYNSMLKLERNVLLEPLYLVRDFNGWDQEICFKIMDTVLTTLDTGAGTKKQIS
jgi:hypothetical protein